MIKRRKHSTWKKSLAVGVVCVFLVNSTFQGISYASPLYENLHPGSICPDDIGGREEEKQALEEELKKFKEKPGSRETAYATATSYDKPIHLGNQPEIHDVLYDEIAEYFDQKITGKVAEKVDRYSLGMDLVGKFCEKNDLRNYGL